ncbi:MAG: FtsX-like permease family protein, partial [Bacteroidetes bacterium]|nr:FtsX-like permease family protein [Bacteroidota bacterium]
MLILLLSSINYINLQTAKGTSRLKEIGIKKTLGFSKNNLYKQFLFESVFISFIAGLMGIVAAQAILPVFNMVIGASGFLGVGITTNVLSSPLIIIMVIAVSLFTGVISGLYPAYVISSFNPIRALKEKVLAEKRGSIGLKKILVTLQFSISLFLLIVSFIIYRQTQYMVSDNLGFNSKNVVYANIETSKKGSFEPIKESLLKHSEIKKCMFFGLHSIYNSRRGRL